MIFQFFQKRFFQIGLAALMLTAVNATIFSVQPSFHAYQTQKSSFASSIIKNAKNWCCALAVNACNIYNRYVHSYIERCLNYIKKSPEKGSLIKIVQSSEAHAYYESKMPSFSSWQRACNALPSYVTDHNPTKCSAVNEDMLKQELSLFYTQMNTRLHHARKWLGSKLPSNDFFYGKQDLFEPYVERLIVASNAQVAFHGDFHGDVHALNDFIQMWKKHGYIDDNFKIIHPDFYIIFLGDYTDRGWYGAEVIYALLRLKNANPDKVFMVRGNHEEAYMNSIYGFIAELERKFVNANDLFRSISRIYNYLPLALYLGSGTRSHVDYIQCCHGGIEIGYNPTMLLSAQQTPGSLYQSVTHLNQAGEYRRIQNHVKSDVCFAADNTAITSYNGFMWSDFITYDKGDSCKFSILPSDRGAGFTYGKHATNTLLREWSKNQYSIRSIFRGHQHTGDMMKRILNYDKCSHHNDAGIGKLWEAVPRVGCIDGVSVVTFAVAPRSGYGYPYDAFGLLYIREGFHNWHLQVIRNRLN